MLESRLFVLRYCSRWLLIGVVVSYSALASALGLGEITLHSALNQPLRADIALVDAARLEEGELSVSLATADEFSRAGVERVWFHNDLKFTPILQGNRSLVRVTSRKPVKEPFLNFLVQLDQRNGRVLREYTLLMDPPGSPAIVPVMDESQAAQPSSEYPGVQSAIAPAPVPGEATRGADAPASDPLSEQLAASVVQNHQLQAAIDELNARLQTQDEQLAAQNKQVAELQTRLAEGQQAAKPIDPEGETPAPVVIEEFDRGWLLIFGLLLVALFLAGWTIRRRRQQVQLTTESAARQEPDLNRTVEPLVPTSALSPSLVLAKASPRTDLSVQLPAVSVGSPVASAAAVGDEFQLNLDDLSMDTSRDLADPMEELPSAVLALSEWSLLEPGIEWDIESAPQAPDDGFIEEIPERGRSPDLEPPHLASAEPGNAGKRKSA